MIERVDCFKTSNGKLFDNHREAAIEEAKENFNIKYEGNELSVEVLVHDPLRNQLDIVNTGEIIHGKVGSEKLYEWMVHNRCWLLELLSSIDLEFKYHEGIQDEE